jgi:hypothetical protein
MGTLYLRLPPPLTPPQKGEGDFVLPLRGVNFDDFS